VYNSATSKNYVNYSSISRCVEVNYGSYNVLGLTNGKILLPSGIICNPLSDSNSFICSLSYSTFADNYASNYDSILFNTGGAKSEIIYCNIIRNSQGSLDTRGTICTYGNLMIESCCILENKATNIFYTASSYTTTLSNCTADKTTNNGYLTIQNTVTKSFILALNHLSTRNCHSKYDSAGTLTAIPYVSNPTKKDSCFTCKFNKTQRIYFLLYPTISLTF
jgi:hypothetical protein